MTNYQRSNGLRAILTRRQALISSGQSTDRSMCEDVNTERSAMRKMRSIPGLVSVIVLNWNGGESSLRCVRSVVEQTYQKLELIVVDNGSTDGSLIVVRRFAEGADRFSRFICVTHDSNLGYAVGMNSGIRETQGDVLVFLNSDVVLSRDFVTRCRGALDASQKIGMVGGKIFRLVRGQLLSEIDDTGLMLRKRVQVERLGDDAPAQFVFGPSGSCPVVLREMLGDVQMPNGDIFASEFFAYHEDTDLWIRAQLRGWRCFYEPSAEAWHVRSGSLEGKSRFIDKPPFIQFHVLKNRYLVILRTFPAALLLRLLPWLIFAEIAIIPYYGMLRPRVLGELPHAWMYIAKSFRRIMRDRNFIQSHRLVSWKTIYRCFVSF